MAARSRPRAGHIKDEIDEERSLWAQILEDAKRIDGLTAKQNAISKRIVDLNAAQSANTEQLGMSGRSESLDTELENNLRENIRLAELIQEEGEALTSKMEILAALRNAHDQEIISASRSASVGKSQRDRQTKRKLTDTIEERDSIAADSPGGHSSPKVMVSSKDRLKMVSGGSRAGSVPVVRESSVKVEDSLDGDQLKVLSDKHRLQPGDEVLYKNNKAKGAEGEGTLHKITTVIGEGKQRRFEIIDADPDPPTPAQPYRASVNHLVRIPKLESNFTLPDLKTGRPVLALYPGTTTFYKAEVVAPWSGKEDTRESNQVRLRFEGEEEAEREMSVDRRYVLPDR